VVVSDNIKLFFSYSIATIVIVLGGAAIFIARLDPPDTNSDNISLLFAGFIGAAITFVFGRETATQATRASQASNAAGVASQNGDRAEAVEAAARKHGN
jgi:hypothetical protein